MKTVAGPLKVRRATSETPTLRMSSRNFTFLRRAPFSPLRSISRCGAHRSPSARSRKSFRSLAGPVSARLEEVATTRGSRKIEERGDDGSCERAYSTAPARKENARRKERQGRRRGKKRGRERKKKGGKGKNRREQRKAETHKGARERRWGT